MRAPGLRCKGRSLRVLHVYRTGFPDTQGGAEEVVRTLTRGLVRRGCEVELLFPSRQVRRAEVHEDEGVRVWRVPEALEIASCNVFLRGIAAFRERAARADVLNFHFPWPWADVLDVFLAPRPRAPRVVTYHSDIVRQRWLALPYAPLMHRFLGGAERIVATSQAYAEGSPVLRRHGARVEVVPIGIDAAAVPPPDAGLLARWRVPPGAGSFAFVGVLRYYKALDVLIRAVAGTELRVVIVGDGPEGGRLRALAGSLRAGNVVFTGRLPDADKWAVLALADGFVLPSDQRSEAYGVALLEAMCAGLPLVTADIGTGVGFVNRDGETGLVVPPRDPAALRAALRRLAADAPLRERLGLAGRARTRDDLASERMVDAYASLYARLCGAEA